MLLVVVVVIMMMMTLSFTPNVMLKVLVIRLATLLNI